MIPIKLPDKNQRQRATACPFPPGFQSNLWKKYVEISTIYLLKCLWKQPSKSPQAYYNFLKRILQETIQAETTQHPEEPHFQVPITLTETRRVKVQTTHPEGSKNKVQSTNYKVQTCTIPPSLPLPDRRIAGAESCSR